MSPAVTLAQALGSRERQEDRARVEVIGACVVAVLADGMGGHYGGDLAAQAAVDAVFDHLREQTLRTDDSYEAVFGEAVQKVCSAVLQAAPGGGCTLDIVVAWPDRTVIRHIGDAQVWHAAPGAAPGLMTRAHGYGNRLFSSIPDVEDDDHTVHTGITGRLILATDGVESPDGTTAEDIVRAQIGRGRPYQDNATAIVIDLDALAAGLTIGPLVTVEPPAAAAAIGPAREVFE